MGQSRGGSYRKYTDAFRLDCVLMAEAAGWPHTIGAIERAAKQCRIPARTLEGWLKKGIKQDDPQAAAELAEQKEVQREELTELFEAEIRAIFTDMKVKREDATYKDLTIAAGIITDKLQLLAGKPTEHSRLSGDSNSPIEIRAIDYRNAITSLAPRAVSDIDASGEG